MYKNYILYIYIYLEETQSLPSPFAGSAGEPGTKDPSPPSPKKRKKHKARAGAVGAAQSNNFFHGLQRGYSWEYRGTVKKINYIPIYKILGCYIPIYVIL
jgi:hypothetical protein